MQVLQITMDSNCFAALDEKQESVGEIRQLVEWNQNGWIDLLKTDVLEKETEALFGQPRQRLRDKTKTLATDYGAGLLGHFHQWPFADQRSRLQEIYLDLWGAPLWQPGRREDSKIRDALHLDSHVLNDRDLFVTNDKGFLRKAHVLQAKYAAVVMMPDACVAAILARWRDDPGQSPTSPEALSVPPPRIIAGTGVLAALCLRSRTEPVFALQPAGPTRYCARGVLYGVDGGVLAEIGDSGMLVRDDDAHLDTHTDAARAAIIDMGDHCCSHVRCFRGAELLLEMKVLGDGSLWVVGTFHNRCGERVARFSKASMELGPGPVCL